MFCYLRARPAVLKSMNPKPSSLSLDSLLDVSDGNRPEMQALARLYVKTIRSNIKTLTRAIKEKQCEIIETTAHSAAGSSAVIGMTSMVPAFKTLEHHGRIKDMTQAPKLLEDIAAAFVSVCDFLESEHLIPSKPSGRR